MGILWDRSGTPQFKKGQIVFAVGAKVQFFSGTGSTPLTTYQDSDEATPHNTASLKTDGDGIWPEVHIPYGTYNYRILDSDDSIIFVVDSALNPEPTDVSDATDATKLFSTGFTFWMPADKSQSGFVRLNGRTIGPVGSGATERANADTEALFTFLWDELANDQAAVSSGRGATAAGDWATGTKTIALPDLRGGSPLGLDTMGNAAASSMALVPFSQGDATTPGSATDGNTITISEANLPAHEHGVGTISTASDGAHTHTSAGNTGAGTSHSHGTTDSPHSHGYADYRTVVQVQSGSGTSVVAGASTTTVSTQGATTGVSINAEASHTHPISIVSDSQGDHTHTMSGNTASVGSGTATNIVAKATLGTWFIKL